MKDLLVAHRLFKSYNQSGNSVQAVKDVSFKIQKGQCLGVVGESGSGKSTLGRLLLALEQPDSGEVWLKDKEIFQLKERELREARRDFQVVFQNPTASLNQRLPVWRSVMEPLNNFPEVCPPFLSDVRHSPRDTAAKLLEMVGLKAAHMDRCPHQLSGGQRQRVAIARGISLLPELLVCDEPTSSLDVSVQAQILDLLKRLQTELGMSYLFISHDIAAVGMMSDRILVMKEGQIVDEFMSNQIMSKDRHEYTRQLVAVVS
ncbi:ATpase component of various ABC-type transport systems [Clostridium aceticum]|uniref:ATpase component of various ABC-type transport systems n=1 Tax=Clostridium aceticum TaxID=84022 RepID=A0A0D8IA61_9CLOT|nr:dipeptide/oligopeptide/nickel ABC transporter ATP-binding protein [Clostridium aceticum]AKL96331.1 ATpase component of various ABC-type transport systems [Clostridium aceticum]KJF26924.1 peptide ABC transporter ATPase [Clostridium aceticum]